jgi:hypothetical protein
MTIDAVLVAIQLRLPYKINLLTQDSDLENLYEMISNTSEPILSLDIVKKNFDISKYEVDTHNQELSPSGLIQATLDNIPQYIQKILDRENKRIKALNGKQYISLDKDDIKQLFSVENWRDKQLNKLV